MKKSIRTTYWFIISIFKRYAFLIIGSLVIGVIVTINAAAIISLIPRSQTIYIGRPGSYDLSQLPLDIQQQISSGLTQLDTTGNPQPDIAVSWNIQESGKVYEFLLDTERTWQDGQLITAGDFDITLQNVEVDKTLGNKLIFRLKDQYAPFPAIVSQPLFRKINYRKYVFFNRTKIIGTNDFSITKIKTSGGVISELTLKSPKETKIYRFYPTEEDVITAFMLGHVDKIEQLTIPDKLSGWKNVRIDQQKYTDRYVAVFFNTQDANLSNKSIRQALAYGIKKDDTAVRALSPINPFSWAFNPQVKPYGFDPVLAKELLDKNSTDAALKITITTTGAFIEQADAIAAGWRGLGMEVDVKVVNFPDTNNYQVLLIGQYIPKDPDQYAYWHSTQGTNFTHYNNPRIDKLLEDGRKTVDQDERTLIYQDFQRFLVEDCPAIFLNYLSSFTVTRN